MKSTLCVLVPCTLNGGPVVKEETARGTELRVKGGSKERLEETFASALINGSTGDDLLYTRVSPSLPL